MSAALAPVVVLGIGNPLRGDDAVGGRVVAALRKGRAAGTLEVPADVDLVDAGAPGPELLPWLAGAAGAVLVDAVCGAEPPGTVRVWRDADASPRGARHGIDDLLAAARLAGELPAAISLVGIEAGSLEPGIGLTRDVEAALPAAVAATLAEVRRHRALAGRDDTPEVRG